MWLRSVPVTSQSFEELAVFQHSVESECHVLGEHFQPDVHWQDGEELV